MLQPDVCNGCGYCIPACPFGVIDRDHDDGRAAKCTLCYDRLEDGLEPACAKACPTDSIQFGPYDELRRGGRSGASATLHERGVEGAYLYGAGDAPEDELAGGLGAFFLLTEPPERYGLPAQADSPIQENVVPATLAAVGAGLLAAAGVGGLVPVGAAAMSDERDMTPAVGVPGEPAFGEQDGREGRPAHRRCWRDGRWSYLYGDDTDVRRRDARPRGDPRGRRSARAPGRCRTRSRAR